MADVVIASDGHLAWFSALVTTEMLVDPLSSLVCWG